MDKGVKRLLRISVQIFPPKENPGRRRGTNSYTEQIYVKTQAK